MIKFSSNTKIVGIDASYSEGEDLVLSIYFNSMHTVISPKSVLDVIYMLNGIFDMHDIASTNIGHKDIDSSKILREFANYGIICDTDITECSEVYEQRFDIAKRKINKYKVHFPLVTNTNVMIAVLLQKLSVDCVFYNDGVVAVEDVSKNIYYKNSDIGKLISTILIEEMGAKNICFESVAFSESSMKKDKDIIVNSDYMNWIDSEECIVINTWNYKNVRFEEFSLFNDKKINISEDLKPLIENFILATRSIDDIIYNLRSGSVSVI